MDFYYSRTAVVALCLTALALALLLRRRPPTLAVVRDSAEPTALPFRRAA